uniref:Uncharacterized protein n=1 Tax=Anguilla anguilla TaxID=7936 RepID=A0A0E9PMK9_ANGAN
MNGSYFYIRLRLENLFQLAC